MSTARVTALLRHEAFHSSRTVMFGWALVVPVVLSLVLALVFGGVLDNPPTLGILDHGDSEMVVGARADGAISLRTYTTDADLASAVESGAVDVALVLPVGLDADLRAGVSVALDITVWGGSLANHRAVITSAIARLSNQVAGRESAVDIAPVVLGEADDISLRQRLLPMLVLMAVFLGGVFLPATSLVRDKERDTLRALAVTPVTAGDLLISKGIFGWTMSLLMGVVTLVINGAFAGEALLMILTLALGAALAAELGLLLGIFLKDVTTLFAVWKSGGIILFAPAIVYVFPDIPEWIGRLFPTFYLVQPIFSVSLQGASWGDVWDELAILAAFVVALGAVVAALRSRLLRYAM